MKAKIILFCLFAFFLTTLVTAQSGRSRNPAPTPAPPPPTKQPDKQPPATPKVLNLPEGGKVVKYDSDGATSLYVLKNGLTIIIREHHTVPLAAVTTYVKAGYFNEADDVAGLAHLMEHMFFKGTTSRGVGVVDRETAALGGRLNASTSYEKTSYYAIAPAESLPKILELQADMLLNPLFDAEELKKEALVVMQESKRKQDNAAALGLEKMYATAFTTHRMKRWRIGSDAILQAATREQMQNFYQNFYRPENIVIVVVGDVLTNQVIVNLQQLYAGFGAQPASEPAPINAKPEEKKADTKIAKTAPKEPAVKSKNQNPKPAPVPAATTETPAQPVAPPPPPIGPYGPDEPAQTEPRYTNERGDIGQSVVTVGYHAPPLTNTADGLKEQATLDVMAAVLGLGRGARLQQVLREKNPLAADVTVEYLPLPSVGMLQVQMIVPPERLDRAEGEYFRTIEKFRREILSEGELQRAKSMVEKKFYDELGTLDEEAEALARYQSQYGNFKLLNTYIDRIRAVTAKDVQQAAAQYFTAANTSVFEYEPRNAAPRTFTPDKFAGAIAAFAPASMQPIKPEDVKSAVALKQFPQGKERNVNPEGDKVIFVPAPLPIKDFSVYRGPRAYVREDQSQPKLTVGVFFQGGRLIEDQTTSGTTELMLRMMLQGTIKRKADLIALEMESYGGEIKLVNEPDFFGFTLDVLSRNADKAVGMMLEIIENPYFDPKEIGREKEILAADQLQQRDNGVQRPQELALASIFPNHPYGLPRYGLASVTNKITDETLDAWYQKTIRRQFPLVMLVGDTDGSSLVSTIFSEGFKRGSDELDQTLKVNLPGLSATPQEQVEPRKRKQTAQVIALRTPAPAQINGYALNVMQNYASGMGGRFFTELRDKQSLAYTVRLNYQQQLAGGALLAYIATSPENEAKAREGLLKELENLVKTPPSDEEFDRARNSAIGTYAIGLQKHADRLLEYARAIVLGRKPADVENQPNLIRAVKKDDVKTALESIIKLNMAGRGVVRGEVTK